MADSTRYTDDDVRAALSDAIKRAGSIRKFAASINVSSGHISQVLRCIERPGPAIAEALGFAEDDRRWIKRKAKAG